MLGCIAIGVSLEDTWQGEQCKSGLHITPVYTKVIKGWSYFKLTIFSHRGNKKAESVINLQSRKLSCSSMYNSCIYYNYQSCDLLQMWNQWTAKYRCFTVKHPKRTLNKFIAGNTHHKLAISNMSKMILSDSSEELSHGKKRIGFRQSSTQLLLCVNTTVTLTDVRADAEKQVPWTPVHKSQMTYRWK